MPILSEACSRGRRLSVLPRYAPNRRYGARSRFVDVSRCLRRRFCHDGRKLISYSQQETHPDYRRGERRCDVRSEGRRRERERALVGPPARRFETLRIQTVRGLASTRDKIKSPLNLALPTALDLPTAPSNPQLLEEVKEGKIDPVERLMTNACNEGADTNTFLQR